MLFRSKSNCFPQGGGKSDTFLEWYKKKRFTRIVRYAHDVLRYLADTAIGRVSNPACSVESYRIYVTERWAFLPEKHIKFKCGFLNKNNNIR